VTALRADTAGPIRHQSVEVPSLGTAPNTPHKLCPQRVCCVHYAQSTARTTTASAHVGRTGGEVK
jgi:hypothetical protein